MIGLKKSFQVIYSKITLRFGWALPLSIKFKYYSIYLGGLQHERIFKVVRKVIVEFEYLGEFATITYLSKVTLRNI